MHITENVDKHHAHIGDTFNYDGSTYRAEYGVTCAECAFKGSSESVTLGCATSPKCAPHDVHYIKINKETPNAT